MVEESEKRKLVQRGTVLRVTGGSDRAGNVWVRRSKVRLAQTVARAEGPTVAEKLVCSDDEIFLGVVHVLAGAGRNVGWREIQIHGAYSPVKIRVEQVALEAEVSAGAKFLLQSKAEGLEFCACGGTRNRFGNQRAEGLEEASHLAGLQAHTLVEADAAERARIGEAHGCVP